MYWRTAPLQEGRRPFGPFVNRNSFATWVVLAVPLCVGYLVAHAQRAPSRRASGQQMDRARAPERSTRARSCLSASVSVMIIALLATLSRSGMVSMAVVDRAVGVSASGDGARRPVRAVLARRPSAPSSCCWRCRGSIRLCSADGSRPARTSAADRLVIWRETMPMVRDFWLTGTGAGTYETAMLVYQRSSPGVRFNQAHNHYLQLASEGGLLLGVPVLLVAGGLRLRCRERERRRTRRACTGSGPGRSAGSSASPSQSVWETGLTAPANAVLAALAAAIVVHPAEDHRRSRPLTCR